MPAREGRPRTRDRWAPLLLVGLLLASCGTPDDDREAGPRPEKPGTFRYVALGDSYTSAPFVPDPVPARGCQRSTGNFPSLVAQGLPGKATLVDRSCGGASTDALTGAQRPGIAPQLDAVDARADLVTVGIGAGNHKLFPILVDGCTTLRAQDPTGSPCRDSMDRGGRDELEDRVDATAIAVAKVLTQIRMEAPDARVLVIGYPAIFPARGTCPDRLPLADGDVAYAAGVLRRLNDVLAATADQAGVGFVDVEKATRGHDICGERPWIQGDTTELPGAMAYHPRAEEQRAVARLVLAALG